MDLPNNTPKVAIQWIGRLQKENEKLKEDELTEESAIEYVYNHTDQYEDWIEGSTIYEELKEENEKLKEYATSAIAVNCDKCNCCITEDDLNMSIDFSCGKLLCESCLDTFSEEPNEEIEKLKQDLKVTREVEINGLCGYKTQIAELKELISQMKQLLSL